MNAEFHDLALRLLPKTSELFRNRRSVVLEKPDEESTELLPLPRDTDTDSPYLTTENMRELGIVVCRHNPKMTLEKWDQSNVGEKMACMRDALHTVEKSQEPQKRSGRPSKGEPDKSDLVLAAFVLHHQYESGGSVGNYEPAGVRALADAWNKNRKNKEGAKLSTAAITRFLQDKFGKKDAHKGYKAACSGKRIGRLLAEWQGEPTECDSGYRDDWHGVEDDEDE